MLTQPHPASPTGCVLGLVLLGPSGVSLNRLPWRNMLALSQINVSVWCTSNLAAQSSACAFIRVLSELQRQYFHS